MTEDGSALQIATFRSEVMVALERMGGDIRVMLQRSEIVELRTADLGNKYEALDVRVDKLEASHMSRADAVSVEAHLRTAITSVEATLRAELAERTKRTIQVTGTIATVVGTFAAVLPYIIRAG